MHIIRDTTILAIANTKANLIKLTSTFKKSELHVLGLPLRTSEILEGTVERKFDPNKIETTCNNFATLPLWYRYKSGFCFILILKTSIRGLVMIYSLIFSQLLQY